MSGSGDIIGSIAEGAMAARAVEPAHGEGTEGHTQESACLNCGTALVGSHCHACGQAAHVHRTLSAFFHDLLHGVLHFEGKIWRTLPLLAWKPGQLTREYIDGRRASYVSPIALFLFVTFLTFAVINAVGGPINFDAAKNNVQGGEALKSAEAKLQADRDSLAKASKSTAEIDKQIADLRKARDIAMVVEGGDLPDTIAKSDSATDQALTDRINAVWRHAKENPELILYKLHSNAYKYAWLLIVLSVPFLWLLFPFNRRFKLYDHTVFVTYSLSFMMLALSLLMAVSGWNPGGVAGGVGMAVLAYIPFHMYRQLRGTYGTSRFGALWRTAALSVFANLALIVWSLALLALVLTG